MVPTSTILIVDDLPAMGELIATLLSPDGYHLEYALSGVEALSKAQELNPDLILLDVMMPDISGFEVCRQLRADAHLAEIPVIMVTALDDRASRLAGLDSGADDFISKPFDQAELRARVRAVTRLNRYRRLLAERARFERLIELLPDGIFIIDQSSRIRLVNPALLRMIGADERAQVLGQPVASLIEPSLRSQSEKLFDRSDPVGQPRRVEAWFVHRDGTPFPVEFSAGRFEWEGEPMTQVIVRDITERRKAEEALRQRNQELAMLNRASQHFVASLDLHEVLMAVLEEVSEVFKGVSASVWLVDSGSGQLVCWRAVGLGNIALQGVHTPANAGLVGWALKTGKTAWAADAQIDQRHNKQLDELAGMVHRSLLCVPFVVQNQALGALQLADTVPDRFSPADISMVEALASLAAIATENALLFRAVNTQRGQLRALAARLADVQEQERQQLARELHDQIGQNLTVINLGMNLIDQMLPPEASPAVRRELSDTAGLVDQTVQQVRTVMAELRPPVLDDYGLVAALRWYGQRFSQRTGVALVVEDHGSSQRCSPSVETALFRIAQEALTNVAKHAKARKVVVTFECRSDQVRLTIADDGQGFKVEDTGQAFEEAHWGFLTMRERALAVGGELHVSSQPGVGTTVTVEVSI